MHTEFSLTNLNLWPSFLLDNVVHPVIMIILCLLSVFVVLGNIIVVTAIWHENQLHSVTNYLIASLAAADCLVGLVVMPFSIISEIILGSWTFGPTWCDLWHSFDVLASTASIMNLCAISLDRYLAITNPISYPTKMTPKRVALLIVSLWTCSSLISFPAILWWRAVGRGPLQQLNPSISTITTDNSIHSQQEHQLSMPPSLNEAAETSISMGQEIRNQSYPSSSTEITTISHNQTDVLYRCVFTDDTYYLLFSSIVSFYGPLCVMLYAYYRIYKAAVQQTRFLKYGSKQVIIGRGGKKNKRQKYISEHSNQVTNEKCGSSEANCNGILNAESYDTQHLVLRAHRGGCGSGAAATTTATTTPTTSVNVYGGKIGDNSNNDRIDQGRKEDSSCELNDQQMLGTNGGYSPVEIDGQNKSNTDINQATLHRDNSCRRADRINSALDKRDKMRMDSQRFDLRPYGTETNNSRGKIVSNLEEGATYQGARNAFGQVSKSRNLMNSVQSDAANGRHKTRSSRSRGAKSLLATMNHNSTIVDVSIVEHDHTSADISLTGKPLVDRSIAHRSTSFDLKGRHKELRSVKEVNIGLANQGGSYRGYDASDELCASESSSSSSGSYGTGSISSILVRPQCPIQKCVHEGIEVKKSCDTIDSRSSQFKLRRALSVDDVEQRCFSGTNASAPYASDESSRQHICNNRQFVVMSSGNKNTTTLMPLGRHRASCGDPLGTNTVTEPKSAKTLDIKSWVRMARARSKKNSTFLDRKENLIKPPASLVPLMMMNSDTSTDSSIVTVETRKIGTIHEAGNECNNNESTCKVNFELEHSQCHNQRKVGNRNHKSGFKKTVSLESGCEREESKNLRLERNAILMGNTNKAKGQLLYCDSDKLIQSIVDLKAIHYIDCANPSSQSYTSGVGGCKAAESLTNASDASIEAERLKSSLVDQRQMIKDNQPSNSAPRQRSVGKKLTKLAKERKAAKTLGIVVGVFILCWLPFFVVNIIVAICGLKCIYKPHILLSIVTWLGWLNSAMNPVIYACWSRDFRRAFRRVLCAWVEFLCLYDGSKFAKKLRLKKGSNYSNAQEVYLNRTTSSRKGTQNTSVTTRSMLSTEASIRSNHRSLLSDEK